MVWWSDPPENEVQGAIWWFWLCFACVPHASLVCKFCFFRFIDLLQKALNNWLRRMIFIHPCLCDCLTVFRERTLLLKLMSLQILLLGNLGEKNENVDPSLMRISFGVRFTLFQSVICYFNFSNALCRAAGDWRESRDQYCHTIDVLHHSFHLSLLLNIIKLISTPRPQRRSHLFLQAVAHKYREIH